ncbi:MAG: hypothetical protein K6F01_12590 [Selenomonas sp.]|uniref:hypothetical protein n=1 Tax=Selenomonas sp. TaxID=2053611 RepID=UPI0025F689B0|nr:hypothetical protein [Selenomonas sp.]MCR5440253.1 hypothetical protein [Selenomonas sp.]
MVNDGFQYMEQRDADGNITHEGVVSKRSPLTTGDNRGMYDVIAENFRVLKELLDGMSDVAELQALRDEVKAMYDDMRTNTKFGSVEATAQAQIATEQAAIATEKAKEAAAALASMKESENNAAEEMAAVQKALEESKTYLEQLSTLEKEISDDTQVVTNHAQAAAASEANAKASETNAAASATSAAESAQSIQSAAETVAHSAAQVKQDADSARQSAQDALASENKAKTSETNAASSATGAESAERAAGAAQQNAEVAATSAASSEANAKASETNAKSYEQKAKDWAESANSPDGADDSKSPTAKTQSSREWALYAENQALSAKADAAKVKDVVDDAKQAIIDSGINIDTSPQETLSFANRLKLWVSLEGGKPVLRVSDPDGNVYKFSDMVQEKSASYVLLSNFEVYPYQWLMDHPDYVQENLQENGQSLYIWQITDDMETAEQVHALSQQIDFDHAWAVEFNGEKMRLDTSALVPCGKFNTYQQKVTSQKNGVRFAEKDSETGRWFVAGQNAYGELGIGYGMPYTFYSEFADPLVLEPEFEHVTDTDGSSYFKAKDPAVLHSNAKNGDIYPQVPPMAIYAGRHMPNKMDVVSGSDTNHIAWHYVAKYDGSSWNGYNFMDGVEKATRNEQTGVILDDAMLPFNQSEILDIVCGKNFTVFLLEDGSVWTCGANLRGQLGAGNKISAADLVISPQPIDIGGFSAIAACEQSWIALGGNGILYACGANTFGQFGQGDQLDRNVLTPIADYVERVQLTAGNLIIRHTDGSIYGAGYNYDDRLALGKYKCITTFEKLEEVGA